MVSGSGLGVGVADGTSFERPAEVTTCTPKGMVMALNPQPHITAIYPFKM